MAETDDSGVSPEQRKAAVLAVVNRDGEVKSAGLPPRVARELGLTYGWVTQKYEPRKFDRRVLQQATRLAAAGELHKVPKTGPFPAGKIYRSYDYPVFVSNARWDDLLTQAAERRKRDEEAAARRDQRWDAVLSFLRDLGAADLLDSTEIDLEDWERIVARMRQVGVKL